MDQNNHTNPTPDPDDDLSRFGDLDRMLEDLRAGRTGINQDVSKSSSEEAAEETAERLQTGSYRITVRSFFQCFRLSQPAHRSVL